MTPRFLCTKAPGVNSRCRSYRVTVSQRPRKKCVVPYLIQKLYFHTGLSCGIIEVISEEYTAIFRHTILPSLDLSIRLKVLVSLYGTKRKENGFQYYLKTGEVMVEYIKQNAFILKQFLSDTLTLKSTHG
jgi:hypothetical protein